MKVLVYGAGVIGSVYAGRLHAAHADVALLARDSRYESLRQNRLVIKNVLTGEQVTGQVRLTDELKPQDFYDLIIISVRLEQLGPVVAVLKQNTASPLILFMLNYPGDIEKLANELHPKQVIFGFPGIGGTRAENRIDYVQIKQQKTTIGETGGIFSADIKMIKTLFEKAGFNTAVSTNIRAWLQIHAVFMACVSAAINRENGDSVQLGRNRTHIQRMVKSIREGFRACQKLGLPVVPANLKTIFMTMPLWFSVLYWQKAMKGKTGTLAMAPHVNAARDEMRLVAQKVLTFLHSSPVATPTLDELLSTFLKQ